MMFTKSTLGRLALSSIVAVLGFVVLNQACGRLPDVVVWWLIYTVGCGVVLNSDSGEKPGKLALLAVLPALIPVLVLGFFAATERNICLSTPSPWIGLLLPPVSWLAIFVFSFARAPLGQAVKFLAHPDTEDKVNRAISVVQIIIAGIAAIVMALSALGK